MLCRMQPWRRKQGASQWVGLVCCVWHLLYLNSAQAEAGSSANATSAVAPKAARSHSAAAFPQPSVAAAPGGTPGQVPQAPAAGTTTPPAPVKPGAFGGSGAPISSGVTEPADIDAPRYASAVRSASREYSIRVDLLNLLMQGRLPVELEVQLFKYLSFQLTPIFILADKPLSINFANRDAPLTQHSGGVGPLSGVSLGLGAWLWGTPLHGYVARLEFTNYAYNYRTRDAAGSLDRVNFTERRLVLFFGSHSRLGWFTFAGGFGLGYELNQQQRCGEDTILETSGCRGKQWIALERGGRDRFDLNGPLHPVYFVARFSVGIVFSL